MATIDGAILGSSASDEQSTTGGSKGKPRCAIPRRGIKHSEQVYVR